MKKTFQTAVFIVLILFASAAILMAQDYGLHRNGFGHLLTDDQRTEVHALVNQMREEGASKGEIQMAVDELLDEWGVEAPIGPGPGKEFGRHGRPPLPPGLTEDQRAEIDALVEEMRADGATGPEIHETVVAMLEGWGFEAPFRKGRGPCRNLPSNGMNEPVDEQVVE